MRILKTSWILFILFWAKTGFSTVYQAETATLYKALTETKNDGFTGESYINFDNEPGSYLELTVGMASEGQQSVKIRFANGTSAIRPMQVKINGQVAVETLEFQPTGDWTNWDTISFLGNFKQGVNLIRITSTGSEGGPNIDYFDVSGEQAQSFTLNVQVSGPGTVIKIPDFPTYFDGQVVQLIVLSDINGVFSGWEGDINTDADTVSILIDGNKTVSANFEEITLEIPEPDFSMTGYATLFGEGYETTTGGEGGKIIYISSINQLINWAKSREDNETPEIV
ncbi:MAG: carbohydrate-binding protein, partial [Prolixibacteraceae bacterium]|nr:carbohydrate-binding protein [Prolixibacteraceae bacterium]